LEILSQKELENCSFNLSRGCQFFVTQQIFLFEPLTISIKTLIQIVIGIPILGEIQLEFVRGFCLVAGVANAFVI
jgi:hypothetical protein